MVGTTKDDGASRMSPRTFSKPEVEAERSSRDSYGEGKGGNTEAGM